MIISLNLPSAVNAVTISTAKDLDELCDSVEHFPQCVSYLETVYKTVKAVDRMNETRRGKTIGSCGPDKGIDTVPLAIALRLAWRDYVAQHQGRLQASAIEGAILAFEQRWPCQR